MLELSINGTEQQVDVPEDTRSLRVLRDVVGLTGTKFRCGIAQCGAGTIHLDGQPVRSCALRSSAAVGKRATTIEAVGKTGSVKRLQDAWLQLQAPKCGYCQSGQIMSAAALLCRSGDARRISDARRRSPLLSHRVGRQALRWPVGIQAAVRQ